MPRVIKSDKGRESAPMRTKASSVKPSFDSLLPEISGILNAQEAFQVRQEISKSERAVSSETVSQVTKLAGLIAIIRLKLYHTINIFNRLPLPSNFSTHAQALREPGSVRALQQRIINTSRLLVRLHHAITRALLPDAATDNENALPAAISSCDSLWKATELCITTATPTIEATLSRWHGATVVAQGGDGAERTPISLLKAARATADRRRLRSQLYRQAEPPVGAPTLAVDAAAARERIAAGEDPAMAARRQEANIYDEGDGARMFAADVEALMGAVPAGDDVATGEGRVTDLARADAMMTRRKRSASRRDGTLAVSTAPVPRLMGFVAARPRALDNIAQGGVGLLAGVERSALADVLLQ